MAPVLRIESPPGFSRFTTRLTGFDRESLRYAMRLTGIEDAGAPIRVILAPEGSGAAREVPSWAAGYANGEAGGVVLIPTRTPSYPDGSLESVLVHEVAHVLVARAARGHPVPRWFNEGLAMTAARERDLGDRARLILELLPGGTIRLSDLDPLFDEGYGRATRAYALSGAFVGDLVEHAGAGATAGILTSVGDGVPFEGAFLRATGMSLASAEASFWRRQNIWNRWLPILTSSFTLWTGITLLALWAVKKRRDKNTHVRERWEVEEGWLKAPPYKERSEREPGDDEPPDEGPPDRFLVN